MSEVRVYIAARMDQSAEIVLTDRVLVVLVEDYEARNKELRSAQTRITQLETYIEQYKKQITYLNERAYALKRGKDELEQLEEETQP